MAEPDPRREYLYVSKRLCRDLVQGATAGTSRWGWSASATGHGVGLSWFKREPAWDNEIEIAQRATKVLADADLIGPIDPNSSADQGAPEHDMATETTASSSSGRPRG